MPCNFRETRMAALLQELFRKHLAMLPSAKKPVLRFAEPGKERQDSVFNGFNVCSAALCVL